MTAKIYDLKTGAQIKAAEPEKVTVEQRQVQRNVVLDLLKNNLEGLDSDYITEEAVLIFMPREPSVTPNAAVVTLRSTDTLSSMHKRVRAGMKTLIAAAKRNGEDLNG